MSTEKLPAMSIADVMAAVKAAQLGGKDASVIDPLIDIKQVAPIVGLTKSPIFTRIKAGTFPAPVRLSRRASRWRLSSIVAWLDAQTSELPAKGAK